MSALPKVSLRSYDALYSIKQEKIMRLEHVNLVASDISVMLSFTKQRSRIGQLEVRGKEPGMANQDVGYTLVITSNILLLAITEKVKTATYQDIKLVWRILLMLPIT